MMKTRSPEAIRKAYQRIYEEVDVTETYSEFMRWLSTYSEFMRWLSIAKIVLFQYSEEDGGFIPVLPGFLDTDQAMEAFYDELQDQETEEFGEFFGIKERENQP
jgi:hypothetical protein